MKKTTIGRCILQVVAAAALLLFLAGNIYAEHSGRYIVPIQDKLFFAVGFGALWAVTVYARACPTDGPDVRRRRMLLFLAGLFCYYLWVLGNMLFFDAAFGRSQPEARPHMRFYGTAMNLKPLKTIRNYLRAYENGAVGVEIIAVNLLGNLAAFAPMGLFLPALLRPMRNFFLFTLGTAAMICTVEAAQFWTHTGSCDVDDLILNLAGALAVWIVIQLPPLRRRAYGARLPKGRG